MRSWAFAKSDATSDECNANTLMLNQGLASQAVTGDRGAITLDIVFAEIRKQSTPPSHQLQQSTPGVMILAMRAEVRGEPVDAFGQQRDLDLRRSGV